MNLRQVAIYAAVVFGTLALLFLVWVFRQALILFLFSLAIAAAARPFVEWFTRRGVRRTLALILAYFLFFGFLLAILLAAGSSLARELQVLADSLARTYDQIWAEWPEGTEIQQAIVQQLPAPAELYNQFSPERQDSALPGILGLTAISAGFIGQVVTALILSIYWSIDQIHFERLWLSLLPVESRARARDMYRNIERDFGTYIRSEVTQSILAGLLLGFGLWAMGVQYPTLLALFGALVWLIPWLGGVLAVLPIALTALSQSVGLGIFASVYAIGVLFLLNFLIEPRFMRGRQFSSLLSILMIIALVEPFGLMGFLVAPPLAAAIELIVRYNLQSRPQPFSLESVQRIALLRQRIESIHAMVAQDEEPLNPQTTNMLARLQSLVSRADEVLEKERARQP